VADWQGYGTEKETGEAIKASGEKRDTIWVTTKGTLIYVEIRQRV